MAFDLAESEFGVTKLLDPEDVDVAQPDEKSVITYISSLFDALPRIRSPPPSVELQHQKEKEKRGFLQEYSMLYKSLTRWLNESISVMENKNNRLPNDYVELKSLTADLKAFRLESYNEKQKENNKIHKLYKELHNNYAKQMLNVDEDIEMLDRLWERLDFCLNSRETHLEAAIARFDKMQKTYERVNSQSNKLGKQLNEIKEQLNDLFDSSWNESASSSTPSSPSLNVGRKAECQNVIDSFKKSINSCEKEIRNYLVEAIHLKDEKFPNAHVLISGLKNMEQVTIDLLVALNSPLLSSKVRLISKKSSNKVFNIGAKGGSANAECQSPNQSQIILNSTSVSITSSLTNSSASSGASSTGNSANLIMDHRVVSTKVSSKSFDSISVTTPTIG
jgi:dystonin